MIAQGYTKQADQIRKNLEEQIKSPRLEFRTWHRVIEETERLHTGWLAVSQERVAAGEEEPAPAEPAEDSKGAEE